MVKEKQSFHINNNKNISSSYTMPNFAPEIKYRQIEAKTNQQKPYINEKVI